MRGWRSAATAALLILAAVIESTWLSMIQLPGAVPPLTLVAVFGFSLRRTPTHAAMVGFFAGIVIDLMPPSTTPLGVSAFAFTIIAFVISMLRPFFEGSILAPLLGAAGAAASSLILRVVIALVAGAEQALVAGFIINFFTLALYAAMLGSVVIPLTQLLDRLLAPRPQATFLGR